MKKYLVFCLLFVCLCPLAVFSQRYDLSKEKVLYTVGYAHLDTQWRWDYQTTINEYIWNTMALNFRLFEKYPDYVFNFSGANRYKMMKEYYPDEYEKLKKYVAAGRWFPSGSSMEENDVLAPSHESIIRQILYGANYFRSELGVTSQEFMIPDCFGFPASLPSILAHCGIAGFSTQKLTWGSAIGIPFNVGRWIGPDGESVVAALNPGSYGARIGEDLSDNANWKKRIDDLGAKIGVYADYMYYGTGDVGGSPTEDSVRWIEKSLQGGGDIKVVSARADELFKDITPAQKVKLPSYKGEFLLTNHSAGSITSQAAMKRWNRKNELLAYKAEAASAMGEWLGGTIYPQAKMNEAWRLVMGGQFHDILPGTSIPRAYEFSQNDELLALNQFGQIFTDASGAVIRALNTQAKGIPVVIFNPLSIEREDVVEATLVFPKDAPKAVHVYDRGGKEAPSQVAKVEGRTMTVIFLAKAPSLSYVVYDARPSDAPCAMATGLKVTERSLENPKYALKLDAAGDIVSILDKAAGKELLAAPAKLEFHYERPEQWPAWNMDWQDRSKPAVGVVEGPAKIKIVENGPARVAVAVERESRHSKFLQVIRLGTGGSQDRIEFDTIIDWATMESSLKAAFPLTVANAQATYSWGVGTIERGNNNSVKFEVPSHQWFDLTDKDGRYGVSVLEDCKYGSDKPADNVVRLTLLYTPGVRASYREQAYQDFGKHEILYALYGHRGDWREGDSNLQGGRLNQPLVAFQAEGHPGFLGKAFSFLKINRGGVVVSAVKKAENGDDLVVRVLETKGRTAKNVELAFAAPVVSAREINGQEQDLASAVVQRGKIIFDMTPYQLKTFAVKLKPVSGALAAPRSAPVELSYDVDIVSYDKHKADGDFDGSGKSFPAEMLPDMFVNDGIVFILGPKADGANNAVTCSGQMIRLPDGNFNKLYILAAAADASGFRGIDTGDVGGGSGTASRAVFEVGGTSVNIPVEVWSGFMGQWDKRLWDGDSAATSFDRGNINYVGIAPGYVRKDNVAFFTTHRHLRTGANDPYMYAYIYKYKIDLPQGVKEIALPTNPRVKILAISVAYNENDDAVPAQPLSDTLIRNRSEYARYQACAKPLVSPEKGYIDYGRPLVVALVAEDENAEIHYTLDGSVPTMSSARYAGPISLNQSSILDAVAFDKVKLPSVMVTGYFSKSLPVKSVQYIVPPAQRRGRPGGVAANTMLIDLVRGTADSGDRSWQVFDKDLDVVLDMGELKTLQDITLGCWENNGSRVFLPASVEISVSADNKNFKVVATDSLAVPEKAQGPEIKNLAYDLKKTQGRYVRVKAKNIGVLPKWHPDASNPNAAPMLNFDELIIK